MAGAFAYGMTPTNSPKGSAFQAVQPSAIPVGVIEMFAGSTAPNGWLVCDGSTVSRKTYSDLFKVIGTTYGAGNSNTTFTLPDMRGRTPIGVGTGSGLTARTLAATTGAETVTLSASNIPTITTGTQSANHTHTGTSGTVSADHSHVPTCDGTALGRAASGFSAVGGGYAGILIIRGNDSGSQTSTGGISANHTHSTTTGNESANHSHTYTNASPTAISAMQPAIAVNFIIKT